MAAAVKRKLPKNETDEILRKAAPQNPIDVEIGESLSRAANEALEIIDEKNYYGPLKHLARKITGLGMAIYGNGEKVKVVFAPALTPDLP
jgi:hypothetical protein